MNLTRFATIALSATALLAASAPLAAHAATSQETANATNKSQVAVYDCANQPQVRPGSFELFCDGSAFYNGLSWSTWNASSATATGTLYVDNCIPNCAAGKASHRTVDLIFWRSEPVKGHPGERGYTQMTTLYPGQPIGRNTYTQFPPGEFPGEF
jgi:hypothetical protein